MSKSFKEALELALKSVSPIKSFETVAIDKALNCVVAKDIECIKNLPPYDNSAMDGYAFRFEDRDKELRIIKTIYAGTTTKPILKESECYKIMTGAKVPSDANCVAPKEICEVTNNTIKLTKDIARGNAIRLKGEEQQSGTILIKKGTILRPSHLALLASQGIIEVTVFKKLKIAILSTGSELKEPWEEASEDEVYNINAISISMYLKQLGFNATYIGVIPDKLEQSIKFVAKLKEYDVAITTGGISMGDADFTKEAFIQNGLKEIFHGVRVKPGHPTMMGIMDKTFVMAMPGNPLAAIINILMLSMPIIYKLQGAKDIFYEPIVVKSAKELHLKGGRVNMVLGNLEDGKFRAYRDNKYGSGMITPLVNSNFIALFGEDKNYIKEDQEIKIIQLNTLPTQGKFNLIN